MVNYLSSNLQFLFRRNGWTANKLAKLCGNSAATIYRLASGKTQNASSETLSAISRVLNVPVDDLVNTDLSQSENLKSTEDYGGGSFAPSGVVPVYNLKQISTKYLHGTSSTPLQTAPIPAAGLSKQNLIAVEVSNNALSPHVDEHDILYIKLLQPDEEGYAKSGDFVLGIGEVDGVQQAVIRELIRNDIGNDWLIVTNEAWLGSRAIVAKQILGIVVARVSKFI